MPTSRNGPAVVVPTAAASTCPVRIAVSTASATPSAAAISRNAAAPGAEVKATASNSLVATRRTAAAASYGSAGGAQR